MFCPKVKLCIPTLTLIMFFYKIETMIHWLEKEKILAINVVRFGEGCYVTTLGHKGILTFTDLV